MKKLEVIHKEVSPVVERANELSIKTQSDMTVAVEMLSTLNRYNDSLEADKEKLTKPLNAALKEIRGRYKPIETVLGTAISLIREKISKYQTRQTQIAKSKEEKISDKISDGKITIEEGVEKLSTIVKPDVVVETAVGTLRFRTDKVLKIVNRTLIPITYYEINEDKILEDLKKGISVPGAEIEEIQVPINSR